MARLREYSPRIRPSLQSARRPSPAGEYWGEYPSNDSRRGVGLERPHHRHHPRFANATPFGYGAYAARTSRDGSLHAPGLDGRPPRRSRRSARDRGGRGYASMRAHLLAEQTGLGSSAGAVLVGSGGDGLGEATRGPRASRFHGRGGGAIAFGPASLVDETRTSARSGVAADPEFRDSMWRFVAGEAFRASGGRDSPAPSPADFDGADLRDARVRTTRDASSSNPTPRTTCTRASSTDAGQAPRRETPGSTPRGGARFRTGSARTETSSAAAFERAASRGDGGDGGDGQRRQPRQPRPHPASVATEGASAATASTSAFASRSGTPIETSVDGVVDLDTSTRAVREDSGPATNAASESSARDSPGIPSPPSRIPRRRAFTLARTRGATRRPTRIRVGLESSYSSASTRAGTFAAWPRWLVPWTTNSRASISGNAISGPGASRCAGTSSRTCPTPRCVTSGSCRGTRNP